MLKLKLSLNDLREKTKLTYTWSGQKHAHWQKVKKKVYCLKTELCIPTVNFKETEW